jgi:hypothetical protein
VLHWRENPKGAVAMTDPRQVDTSEASVDGEITLEVLDSVAGGVTEPQLDSSPIPY